MHDLAAPTVVLTVDDEPDFAELTVTSLELEADRFTVETAIDAETDLNRLREGAFDRVISDHHLADIDGLEFLNTIRPKAPMRPFILFTGKSSKEVASEAISAGMTDSLQKATGTSQYAIVTNRMETAMAQRYSRAAAVDTERCLTTIADN